MIAVRVLLCFAVGSLAVQAVPAPAADEVAVHHVQLRGHEGSADLPRTLLLEKYEVCVEQRKAQGLSFADAPKLPAHFHPGKMDIYYAANRSLVVHEFDTHDIDMKGNCSMVVQHRQIRNLYSIAGRCDMEAKPNKAKKAIGVCEAKLHETAEAKLPAMPSDAMGRAGAQTIAGTQCEVQRVPLDRGELCIAPSRAPFDNVQSVFNAGRPGLLLAIDTRELNYRAESVKLNAAVSRELFEVPAGYTVHNLPLNRKP